MKRMMFAMAVSAAMMSTTASAETLFLLCTNHYPGGSMQMYATIDLTRRIAKIDAEPVSDRNFHPADISSSEIRWPEPHGQYVDNIELNRYSFSLKYYSQTGAGHSLAFFTCERAPVPQRKG
jgi:hypothetical protein